MGRYSNEELAQRQVIRLAQSGQADIAAALKWAEDEIKDANKKFDQRRVAHLSELLLRLGSVSTKLHHIAATEYQIRQGVFHEIKINSVNWD